MKVAIYIADKPREHYLAKCVTEGVRRAGDKAVTLWRSDFTEPLPDVDIACVVGVKSNSNWFIKQHVDAGKHALYFDKGYVRQTLGKTQGGWLYWRVAIDGHQPTDYFRKVQQPSDRWDALRLRIFDGIGLGDHILYAGSSQKFCDFYQLGDATEYAINLIREIKKHTKSKVIYRPKPSWREAIPVPGTIFSRPPNKIFDAIKKSHVMVTYGSNAVFEASIIGMPTLVIGTAVTRSIAERKLSNIDNPYKPSAEIRYSLLCDLAYCQWKMSEFESGKAWLHLRNTIEAMDK